jgi:hypothetical protein
LACGGDAKPPRRRSRRQALASDRELARRYELVRQELAETIHLNETLGAPSARAMEKLFAAIDAYEAGARRRRPRPISRPFAATLSGNLSFPTPNAFKIAAVLRRRQA